MEKMITWGTPKYIQVEVEDKKHQFRDVVYRKNKRSKICKFTKTKDHIFSLFVKKNYDWFPLEQRKRTIVLEYHCGCGKKRIEFRYEEI